MLRRSVHPPASGPKGRGAARATPVHGWWAQLRLLRYAKPHWARLLIMIGAMGLSIGLEVLKPWPTKLLIDQVLDKKPVPGNLQTVLGWLPAAHGVEGL